MTKTITIKAYRRPEILRKTLKSLLHDKGSNDWLYCISVDLSENQQEVIKVIHDELKNKVSYTVLTNDVHLNIAKNHVKAVSHAFDVLKSDWNLDFDDDYIIYDGWNTLCNYYINVLFHEQSNIFSGHLQSQFPFEYINKYTNPEKLIRVKLTYSHHGTLLSRKSWINGYSEWLKNMYHLVK